MADVTRNCASSGGGITVSSAVIVTPRYRALMSTVVGLLTVDVSTEGVGRLSGGDRDIGRDLDDVSLVLSMSDGRIARWRRRGQSDGGGGLALADDGRCAERDRLQRGRCRRRRRCWRRRWRGRSRCRRWCGSRRRRSVAVTRGQRHESHNEETGIRAQTSITQKPPDTGDRERHSIKVLKANQSGPLAGHSQAAPRTPLASPCARASQARARRVGDTGREDPMHSRGAGHVS